MNRRGRALALCLSAGPLCWGATPQDRPIKAFIVIRNDTILHPRYRASYTDPTLSRRVAKKCGCLCDGLADAAICGDARQLGAGAPSVADGSQCRTEIGIGKMTWAGLEPATCGLKERILIRVLASSSIGTLRRRARFRAT